MGVSPRFSMVRYEMQLVASSTRDATKALVGQASRQRVHVPHLSASKGASGSSSTPRRRAPMKKKDPCSGLMRLVFFPNHPSPARRARSRSRIGPVSTYDFPGTEKPVSDSSQE